MDEKVTALPGDPAVRKAFHEGLDRLEDETSELRDAELAARRAAGKLKINVLTTCMESSQDRNLLTKSDDYEDVRLRISLLGGQTVGQTELMRRIVRENADLRAENAVLRNANAELVARMLRLGRDGARARDREERRRANEAAGYAVPEAVGNA